MTARLHGTLPVTLLEGNQDKDGHRQYVVEFLIDCDPGDGPKTIMECPGLPLPGDWYQIDVDNDLFAWCYWAMSVKKWSPANEQATQYKITKTFSTKPEDTQHCREKAVEDPLSELPKISGSFSKYTEEAVLDRFGRAITYSSFERIRGPQNEWDANRLSIKIQQNVASFYLGVELPSRMVDCVNAFPLWGFPARTIKLSSAPWEKKYYGPCIPYYSRTLEFDTRYRFLDTGAIETWDRSILDESSKVLQGKWQGTGDTLTWVVGFQVAGMTGTPNPNNPMHYMKCADVQGNLQKMVLNGHGIPAGVLAPSGGLYISIVASNTGFPLENGSKWVPLQSDPTKAPPDWDANTPFVRGNLAKSIATNHYYVALLASTGDIPSTTPTSWFDLGTSLPVNKGAYSSATTYAVNEYVSGLNQTGAAGYIFVQRYPSVDFTLLGIPISL